MKMIKHLIFLLLSNVAFSQTITFQATTNKFTKQDILYELDKYPKGLIQNYLYQITVVNDDRICGRSEAYSNRIILSSSCNAIQMTIHHELSSVLLRQYDMTVTPVIDEMYGKFLKLNGDFKYNHNVDMHHIDELSKTAEHFYNYKYAQSDFENDFNIIAQSLFIEGSKTIEYMNSHIDKPVAKKIQLVIDFYHKLNSEFTVSYFKHQNI